MPLKPLQAVAENSVLFRPGLFKGNPQVNAGSLFHSPNRGTFVMQGQPLPKDFWDTLAPLISDREESMTHEKCTEVNHTFLSIASAR